ncbi:MAG: 5'-nucleotidase C-terminal domain-containing protein [Prevotella sp.]|nr:5'-nucleotidase C-terminal domain-containing protein [Prevotella sp.]
MNKKLLTISAMFTVAVALPVAAQQSRDDFAANRAVCADNYLAYPDPVGVTYTAPPRGYQPVYISHYGRHGSRWLIGRTAYEKAYDVLREASDAGQLTPLGFRLMQSLDTLRHYAQGRDGELTPLGHRQHQGIGRRMYGNFPQLFNGKGKVEVRSSTVIRCILSMTNCINELKSLSPSLRFDIDAAANDMAFINNRDKLNDIKPFRPAGPAGSMHSDAATQPSPRFTPDRFLNSIFASESYWRNHIKHPTRFAIDDVWKIYADMQSLEPWQRVDLNGYFTDEELYAIWIKRNADWYQSHGPSTQEADSKQMMRQNRLLRNIVEKADSCLAMIKGNAKEPVTASLRFGHEVVVMPLVCSLNLNGFGTHYANTDMLEQNGWYSYRMFPMASNVQIVFYQNPKAKDSSDDATLVKVMLNEREATMPQLTPVHGGVYYRWSDLRNYMLQRVAAAEQKKSIVILFENDVHCGIDGYAQMRGLADAIERSDTASVALVSMGDYLQGALAGAISGGQYIVDIMRKMHYDAITLGNHEFDYGTEHMIELLTKVDAPVVSSNFFKYGDSKPVYAPYIIKEYGDKRIAFIGTTTPETMRSERYAFYDANDRQTYDLRTDSVYAYVQRAADEARREGADYVIVMSHLGEEVRSTGVTSHRLAAATRGIDVILDGHTHAVIPCDTVMNLDNKPVPVTQTGTQFANIGKLVITPDGKFSVSLIPTKDIPYTNAAVTATVDSIKALMSTVTSRPIATLPFPLSVHESDGSGWIVRHNTAAIGDLVADAMRQEMNADIGIINGGGLRNGLPQGNLTYGDIVSVQPFDNHLCLIEATGAQILSMLTKCTQKCPEYDGSFPHVSGMKYTVHSKTDRVTDVSILNRKTGRYEKLNPAHTYTIGLNDYYQGGGFYSTLKQCRLIKSSTKLSRDALADYLEHTLNGKVGDTYRTPQGRVTVIDD